MSRVSVIIPVYNASDSLGATLKSLQNQTFKDFEVVIVNDGSTDNSLEIIEEWINSIDIETRVISQENKGLGASRNTAIRTAKAGWLALLDADDMWHERKLEYLQQDLTDSPSAGVIYHRVYNIKGHKRQLRSTNPVRKISELLTHDNPLVPSAVVLNREVALKFPFSEDRELHGAEDLHLWTRLLHHGILFKFNTGAISYYRVEGGMSSKLETHLQCVFKALEKLREEQIIDPDLECMARKRKHYEAGRFYQKQGDHQQARMHYQKALVKGLKSRLLIAANRLRLAL